MLPIKHSLPVSTLTRLAVIGALLLLVEMLVMEEWKDVLRVGRMGEAKLEGASLVTSGLNTCGLSPSSDM
jgi:hypothetical protein